MATPVVAGAVALLLQQNPALTPDQVKARLMKTASKHFPRYTVARDRLNGAAYPSQADIFTVGAGYLDIASAMANTDVANFQALSPVAVFHPDTKTVSLVSAASLVTATPWCGATLSFGATPWSGETPSCGETRLFGAILSCGATRSCGATPSCGETPSCGAIRWCGVIPRWPDSPSFGAMPCSTPARFKPPR